MTDETRPLECGCIARVSDLVVVTPCKAHVNTPPYKVAAMHGMEISEDELEDLLNGKENS